MTFFTRAEGKVRGVARSAKKSKRRFGGALEPLTYVRAFYDVRERNELARLDACEVLASPMASEVSYARAVALGHIAELLDELLPDREANDAIFRLTSVGAERVGQAENLDACHLFRIVVDAACGISPGVDGMRGLRPRPERSRAYFHALADGLMCVDDKRLGVFGDFERVARAGSSNVPRAGGQFRPGAVAQGTGIRSTEIPDSNPAAASGEEVGHGGHAGEGRLLGKNRDEDRRYLEGNTSTD